MICKFKCLLFLLLVGWQFSEAEILKNIDVGGKVTDFQGNPIASVSVTVKGSNRSTQTDENGDYQLKGISDKAVLVFRSLGYKQREVTVNGRSTVHVSLESELSQLDEVVVVGYGTVKKSHITGAVSKLTNENLDEIPVPRLDNALVGRIAGVSIQQVNPESGAAPTVRIRGLNSISAGSEPLVVVDGYPIPDGLAFVNPADVESIEVLKDAASAAIYGSRGANGVILVTTKMGQTDVPRFAVKSFYGIKEAYKLNPIMSFTEYAEGLYREAALREDDPTVPTNRKNLITNQQRAAYIIENQILGTSTDWQREGLQDASIYNVQLNISGGKKDQRYMISGNLQEDQGVMRYSKNTRGSFRAKMDGALSSKLKFSLNVNPSYIKNQRPAVNYTDYMRFMSYVPVRHDAFSAAFANQQAQWADIIAGDWAQARHFNGLPYAGTMPDGTFWSSSGALDPWNTNNNTPLSIASRETRGNETYRLVFGGDLKYAFSKDLELKTSVGGYYLSQRDFTFTRRHARQDGATNQGLIGNRQSIDLLWENTLNYNKSFGDHHLTGLLGFTAQSTSTEISQMLGSNFPTDDFETLNQAGQISQADTYTLKDKVGLLSYLGRVNYDYKGKYLLSASLRTDGSSYFANGQKFGWFPSVSAGWRIDSESFMKDVNWMSALKLRGSYGATGNNNIESFSYVNLLYPSNYSFGGGTGSVDLGLSPNSDVLANPFITWERTFAYNIGLDMGFLKDRFNLTVEYYNSTTDRLLFKQSTMSFSGSNEFWNNVGKVRNRGLEIEFSSTNIKRGHFEWRTAFNIAANRNKLLALGGEPFQLNYGERNEVYINQVGGPAIQFFGYRTDGVWLSQEEIDDARAAGLTTQLSNNYFQAGGLKFVDVNGDNVIGIDDRTVMGTPFPDFIWGMTNTMKYRNFDLNIVFQGSQGGQLINGDINYNEIKRFSREFNNSNRWVSAAHPGDGKTPYETNGENSMLADFVVEDASFAAIRNIILGYTLQQNLTKKIRVRSLRVYAAADNLFFLMGSSYRGINPEARITSSAYSSPLVGGYQRGSFPIGRTFTFGLDVNF